MPRTWNESLAVGDRAIDGQHQEIFRRAAALTEALARRDGRSELGDTIGYIVGYTLHHFRDEEFLMASLGYPELEAHARLHAAFAHEMRETERRYREQGASLPLLIGFYNRVCEWLSEHIASADKAFAAWRPPEARAPLCAN